MNSLAVHQQAVIVAVAVVLFRCRNARKTNGNLEFTQFLFREPDEASLALDVTIIKKHWTAQRGTNSRKP